MTATKRAKRPRIVGDDKPPCDNPLTMGELIMPSFEWTRVCMYRDEAKVTQGYWTVRVYQDAVALNDIYVLPHERGRGLGSRFLQDVIDYADSLGLPLALYCAPGTMAMDYNQLRAWYSRHGFTSHPQFHHEHCEMDELMLRYCS